jgi:hypothetical protein
MFTIIIAIACAVIGAYVCTSVFGLDRNVSICIGIGIFLVLQLLIGLIIRRKINNITGEIQTLMEKTQNKLNRQLSFMQTRPISSPKAAQQVLEKEQNTALHKALEITKKADRYFKWNLLLKRQINTMRMMLYFQLKEFKKVDAMLPGCLIFDVRSVAIKAVRMYKNQDPYLDKYLAKKCRRFKGDDAVLLYALYSWILVKQEKYELASAVLAQAKNRLDNPVLNANRENLVNGKIKHFSNANLGEAWYSLYLEEPKIKQQRVVQRGF